MTSTAPPPAGPAVPGVPEQRLEAALRAERVQLYRAGKWSAIGGQCVIVALLLWVVYMHVPTRSLALWLGLVALSLLARATCDLPRGGDALAAELARSRAALLGMGVALGLAGWLAFPQADFRGQIFTGFMMAGLAAGALTLSSFDLRWALAYAIGVLTPTTLRLLVDAEPATRGTGAAMALFVAFLALAGRRAQRNMKMALAVREADSVRTESLLESQRRLEQMTAELRQASEELRLTFEHMDQGILCLGADGRVSFYNRRVCELTGLPEAFLATRPSGHEIARYQWAHGHFDESRTEIDPAAREAIRLWREGVQAMSPRQYFRSTLEGTVLDVKTASLPGGGFVRTFTDVTALVEANRRLRDSEAQARKLALVASHTDDAVVITDADRRIEWVNEAFSRLTGYTLAEVVGRRTSEFLRGPQTDNETAVRIGEELRRTSRAAGEILHYRKDGSSYWFALETQVIRGDDGAVLQYIGVGRDVTGRRAAEQALRAARDEAERASRAKSDFLSAMSHELRTPMNAILGFAQLLEADQQHPLPARQREQVQRIGEAGTHLLALINDVLDLARVEAGREVIVLGPVELAPLVDECLVLVRPLAQERGIDVAVLPGPPLPRALADRTRLKQVLLNLLANAIKYNAALGQVRVRGSAGAAHVSLEVADTGPGLGEPALRRLFTAFERLGAERGPVEGAGIGLALSRRLVELMHGTIGVRSEPGRGSTFTVTLPCEAASVPARGAEPAAAQPQPLSVAAFGPAAPVPQAGQSAASSSEANAASSDEANAGTVLYIEDNAVNVLLMQAMLEPMPGLKLLVAERPEAGLALACDERPDLILLDIQLPGIDGYEVLKRLRADERTRGIPTIAISANAMRGDIERGLTAGFDDYLTKPLDVARLRAAVRQRLAAARSPR